MLSNVKLSRLCRPTDGQTVKQYLPDLSIRGHKDWRVLHTRKNKGFFGKGIRGGKLENTFGTPIIQWQYMYFIPHTCISSYCRNPCIAKLKTE